VESFQISLDTLELDLYEELHGAPGEMLDVALRALREVKAQGFHTTVSVRLTPRALPGIPALLDRAVAEGCATVTIHCPVYTGRAESTWPLDTDLVGQLEPVFEHFLALPEHWVVETNLPWARYHSLIRSLSKRTRVIHAGCGAARWRLAIGASGQISPCVCLDREPMLMGNVRQDDLASVFRESPIAKLMREPWEYGICADCENVRTCGGGCRAGAASRGERVDALDTGCPVRRARMMKEALANE
jgi:radical SAM protein with 4Fe4S-binding SPASM domain